MNTCKTCSAYSALTKECRAHAPEPMMIQNGTQTGVLGIFPGTRPEQWCAEWRDDSVKNGIVRELKAPDRLVNFQ